MATGDGQPKMTPDRREILSNFQCNSNGICGDYCNKFIISLEFCKDLSGLYEVNFKATSDLEKRETILEQIGELLPYTEWAKTKKLTKNMGEMVIFDLLTIEGSKIVNRMDQIVLDLKGISENKTELDILSILKLLEEMQKIMYH